MINNNIMSSGPMGLMAMLDAPVMAPALGGQMGLMSGTETSADPAFGNLLDLVSDLEVSEAQAGTDSEFLESRIEELVDPEVANLKATAQQASALMTAWNPSLNQGTNVGRPTDLKQDGGETLPVEDLNLRGLELGQLSQNELARTTSARTAHSSEAAQEWAAAIATGDLKSVTLEAAKPEVAPSPFNSQPVDLKGSARPEPVSSLRNAHVATMNDANVKSVPATTNDASVKLVPATAMPAAAMSDASAKPVSFGAPAAKVEKTGKTEKIEAAAQPERTEASSGFSRATPSKVEAKDNIVERESAPKFSLKSPKAPEKEAVSGSEFLLRQASEPAAKTKGAATLVAASSLGAHGDRRVSAESLDFVADKIDALRAQGGGKISVVLAPRELGAVEIRVQMRPGGGMKVELLAERPETQRALEGSKTILSDRLERIAPATLEVVGMRPTSLPAGTRESASASQDLLSTRHSVSQLDTARGAGESISVKNDGGLLNDRVRATASTGEASSDWMSSRREGFLGDQREERRQKAMDGWESQFGQRKSA